jgi:hypothetical protein
MTLFDALDTSAPRALPKWAAPAAGLLVAGAVACLGCRLPPHNTFSWPELFGSAAERVLLVFVACATTVWALCLVRSDKRKPRVHPPILRTSLDATWLAPVTLLICENSAWAVAIAAVLVASTTKSFRSLLDRAGTTEAHEPLGPSFLGNAFSLPNPSLWHSRLSTAVCGALCAEGAAVAGFAGSSLVAAMFGGVSSAVWMCLFTAGEHPLNQEILILRDSPLRTVMTMALAIVITSVGLMPYLRHMHGYGGVGVPVTTRLRHEFSPRGRQQDRGSEKKSDGAVSDFAEAYSGIVLRPKKQTFTPLVAPAPILGGHSLGTSRSTNPLVVPFNGVYWFFEAPDIRPPTGSREAHGSPELWNVRSTDQHPLSMEVHQNLGILIGLDCCSRIQVAIRNTDRYPETVSLELILTDTSLPTKPSQSLGSVMVKSTRPWQLYGDRPPVSETLSFDMPAHSAIHHFDEVTIMFRLDPARADFGAKIGIERFVLVPRGGRIFPLQ